MIEYRVGDVLDVPERPVIIAHVCNDVGRFNAGVARAVRLAHPRVATIFETWARGRLDDAPPYQLGQVLRVAAGPDVQVANMVAQHGLRSRANPTPIRYDHLETCLQTVAHVARRDTMGVTVAMPRVGCGLAGGRWDHVEPLVARTLAGVPVVVYDLDDAQEPSPHEGTRRRYRQ